MEYLKYSQATGFEEISLETDLVDDGRTYTDEEYFEALGFNPMAEMQEGVVTTDIFSGYMDVYKKHEKAKHDYPFLVVLPDHTSDTIIVVKSAADVMSLRVVLAPLISTQLLSIYLPEMGMCMRKSFRAKHHHNVEHACNECDPEQVAEEKHWKAAREKADREKK